MLVLPITLILIEGRITYEALFAVASVWGGTATRGTPLRTPNLHRSMRAKICFIIGVVTNARTQVTSRPLSTTMSATKLRPKPSRTCGACAATAARMWLRTVCCMVCVIVAVSVTSICGY